MIELTQQRCDHDAAYVLPGLEVGDIFRDFGAQYRLQYSPPRPHLKVMEHIESCRTAKLGGHLMVCDTCSRKTPMYNPCCDRHCPKCQSLSQAKWIAGRLKRVLNTHYFHLVFTLPGMLRSLVMLNRRRLFAILMQAAARTLSTLARDEKMLGAKLGITVVLHTWTRELLFHPHVHCIVTGGGLTPDGDRWISARDDYLFPVKLMSALFRGIFLTMLVDAEQRGELRFSDEGETRRHWSTRACQFRKLIRRLKKKKWVAYAKRPFGGPAQVIRYLGRYTHRTGISNQRINGYVTGPTGEKMVRFRTRGKSTIDLPPLEFIRRFLLHVLPSGFTKIRHYGLHAAGNVNTRLAKARELLGEVTIPEVTDQAMATATDKPEWMLLMEALTGKDISRCPYCQQGHLQKGHVIVYSPQDIGQVEVMDSS